MTKRLSILLFLFFISCSSFQEKKLPSCSRIDAIPGPEDFALNEAKGLLYISSHNRRKPEEDGKIFLLNLNEDMPRPTILNSSYPPGFKPLGMSLVKKDTEELLYVISRPLKEEENHRIEVFKIQDKKLEYIKQITDPSIISPNELVALPSGEIFVSNDKSSRSESSMLIDAIFGLKRSRIAYFDGKSWTLLENAVGGGNGIHYLKEKDEEFLFRTAMFDKKLYKYKIIRIDGKLKLKELQEYELGGAGDNITETEDKSLLFTSHPSFSEFLSHKKSKENISPSVVHILRPGSQKPEILYANSGKEISAASTALIYKDKLYLAQIFDSFLIRCPLSVQLKE